MTSSSVLYRRSCALFHYRGDWDPRGRPATVNGRLGTFTRSGSRWAIDSAGRFYQSVANEAAAHSLFDASGVLADSGVILGPAQTNLVTNPDTITAAGGWTVGGGITPTAAAVTAAGIAMTLLSGTFATAVVRSVTLTGNGTKDCCVLLKFGGVAGTTIHNLLRDETATTTKAQITATWAADGTAAIVGSVGTLRSAQRVADGVYLAIITSTSCTATNTHSTGAVVGGTSTAVYVAGVTVVNATQLAVPYTQAGADFLRFAVPFLPRELTALIDVRTLGFESTGSARLWDLGELGSSSSNARLRVVQTSSLIQSQYLSAVTGVTSGSNSTALPTYGQRVRVRSTLSDLGSIRTHTSFDVAAETSGLAGTAQTLDAAWGGGDAAVLALGSSSFPGSFSSILLKSFKVATGNRTLAQMEALF